MARAMTPQDEAVFQLYCREVGIPKDIGEDSRKDILSSFGYQQFALEQAVVEFRMSVGAHIDRLVSRFVRRK